ncbi:hypothetical protein Droror1_Dr00009873 [Drosera rotundifolia]
MEKPGIKIRLIKFPKTSPAPPTPGFASLPPPGIPTPVENQNRSLYVGDLDPRVTTADLLHVFSGAGKVTGVRVCSDAVTGESLCYGYVNFENAQDAKKAMLLLNHTVLKGKSMRIMWHDRNPITRKTGVGNLFVKNLDRSITGASLQDAFQKFGTVLSCKIAADENGKSKGFGYVQFEKNESAMAARDAMHDTMLLGKKLHVTQFVRKSQWLAAKELKSINLYVKNLAEDLTEGALVKKFSEFGMVESAIIMRDTDGKSKGFGFVSFSSPEEARKAAMSLNGAPSGSKNLFVGRAQKKAERKELKEKARSANVYVKNLNPLVNDAILAAHFSSCGEVVSKKVMHYDNGLSKMFGFVTFSSPVEAERAVRALHGSKLLGRRLYVAVAQRKEDRLKALQEQFSLSKTAKMTPAPWFTADPAGHCVVEASISPLTHSSLDPWSDELCCPLNSSNGMADFVRLMLKETNLPTACP